MATERQELEAISDGVQAWLENHPISGGDCLVDGARKGIVEWLDRNRDDVIEAIAEKIADRLALQSGEVGR